MELYMNLGGNSSVVAYKLEPDSITVQFRDGSIYIYTYEVPGVDAVEHMKYLARQGFGLNAFISTHVKGNYARKFR